MLKLFTSTVDYNITKQFENLKFATQISMDPAQSYCICVLASQSTAVFINRIRSRTVPICVRLVHHGGVYVGRVVGNRITMIIVIDKSSGYRLRVSVRRSI